MFAYYIYISSFFVYILPNFGTALNEVSSSSSNCGFKWVKLHNIVNEKDVIPRYKSYGKVWMEKIRDVKHLVIWVKQELFNDLINELQQTNIRYSISQLNLCSYPREEYSTSQVNASMNLLLDAVNPEIQERSQLLSDDLPSVNVGLIIDYGDGTIYSNLFYSLKVVTPSETKRFTLGEKNYFVLGGLRSRKGLWSFEKSETDGLYILRNRAALKYNEVIYDDKCFTGQVTKPCLTYYQFSSGSSANQLKFRITNTDSTGVHIYVNDGVTDSCLEYVEQSKGLVQVVSSDDNTTCAIFIPTLKSTIESENLISIVSMSPDSPKLLGIDYRWVTGIHHRNRTLNFSKQYDYLSDIEKTSVLASYSRSEFSNQTSNEKVHHSLENLIGHFFPEVEECNMIDDRRSMQCKLNQRLIFDISILLYPFEQMSLDFLLPSYDTLEIEFLETLKHYAVVDVLLKCETLPCTRVLQQRLPNHLVKAIGGSENVKTRSGTVKFGKVYTTQYRLLSYKEGDEPIAICT